MNNTEDKELYRLASLVGTDAKTPEENLLKYINAHYLPRQKIAEALDRAEKAKRGIEGDEFWWGWSAALADIRTALGMDKE